jgi:hypothetical protein
MWKTGNRRTEGDTCVGRQCGGMCQTVYMWVQCVVASTATDGGSNKLPFSESLRHMQPWIDRTHFVAPLSHLRASKREGGSLRCGTRFESRTGHNSPDSTPSAGGRVERRVLSLV